LWLRARALTGWGGMAACADQAPPHREGAGVAPRSAQI